MTKRVTTETESSQSLKCDSTDSIVLNEVNKKVFDSLVNNNRKCVFSLWATWCVPCKREFPHIIKYFQENNYNLFLVCTDKPSDKQSELIKKALCAKGINQSYIISGDDGLVDFDNKKAVEKFTRAIRSNFSENPGYPYTIVVNNGKIIHEFIGLEEDEVFRKHFDNNIKSRLNNSLEKEVME